MPPIRIAAVSLNQTPLDWDHNRENIVAALDAARAAGASLVCLPELCVTGYGCEDAFLWPGTRTMALQLLAEVVAHTKGLVATFGLPLDVDGEVFNAVAVVVNQRVIGFACKRHLAGEGLHYEPRWFAPWPKGKTSEVRLDAVTGEVVVPVGDLVFDVGGVRFGFEICEDAWVSERPGAECAASGAQLILGPSASHFAFGKHSLRRRLVLEGAKRFSVAYVYCNLLGNDAGRAIYDGDALIAAASGDERTSAEEGGEGPRVVAETRRLSFGDRQMACATVTLPDPEVRPVGAQRRQATAEFEWPEAPRDDVITGQLPVEQDPSLPPTELPKNEAFARVIALGLFDYMRKSRSRGFVVSLSGGADSAAVATLCRLMVRLGIDELGHEGFSEKLGYFLDASLPEEELARALLLTVYQGTRHSSDVTRTAAAELAAALGSEHHEFEVQELVDGYSLLVEGALGRPLDWVTDDIALQNIQARVRAPSVWMLANVRGALLLSTSNRSEAAVGYATMDGDTSGGLSPIAGIDKAYLRRWLVWMEEHGVSELGPLAALRAVNVQQPTAELRPAGSAQTDEGDLMPYEVLDLVERLAVVQRLPVAEVLDGVVAEFSQFSREQLHVWVERFYRLFSRNQWKRERYAPSFHVDDANLDPKTWCRFPILSGGFARELRELK